MITLDRCHYHHQDILKKHEWLTFNTIYLYILLSNMIIVLPFHSFMYLFYYLVSILSYFFKRYDVTFPIVNFPFINRNMLASPAFAFYISQLLRYYRTCSQYRDFMDRAPSYWRQSYSNKATFIIGWSHRLNWSSLCCDFALLCLVSNVVCVSWICPLYSK